MARRSAMGLCCAVVLASGGCAGRHHAIPAEKAQWLAAEEWTVLRRADDAPYLPGGAGRGLSPMMCSNTGGSGDLGSAAATLLSSALCVAAVRGSAELPPSRRTLSLGSPAAKTRDAAVDALRSRTPLRIAAASTDAATAGPVLEFQSDRWTMWEEPRGFAASYEVSARLVDGRDGSILWRASCRRDVPPRRGNDPAAMYGRLGAECGRELGDALAREVLR